PATPASGYVFVNWTEGGTVVSTAASYSFTLAANRNLVANFQQTFSISVSASPTAGGTVSGGGTFASGSTQTVTATPASGYTFVNWTAPATPVRTARHYPNPGCPFPPDFQHLGEPLAPGRRPRQRRRPVSLWQHPARHGHPGLPLHVRLPIRERHRGEHGGELQLHARRQPQPGGQF